MGGCAPLYLLYNLSSVATAVARIDIASRARICRPVEGPPIAKRRLPGEAEKEILFKRPSGALQSKEKHRTLVAQFPALKGSCGHFQPFFEEKKVSISRYIVLGVYGALWWRWASWRH
jgi:hypothetical protein